MVRATYGLWLVAGCIPQGEIVTVEGPTGSTAEARSSLTVFWDFDLGGSCAAHRADVTVIDLRRDVRAGGELAEFPITEECDARQLAVAALEPGPYVVRVEAGEPDTFDFYEGELAFELEDGHRLFRVLLSPSF